MSNLALFEMDTTACPELLTIQKKKSLVCEAITTCVGITWFAKRIMEEGFISSDAQSDIVHMHGVSSYTKCNQLLSAIEAQVKIDSSKYSVFMEILKEQAVLHSTVDMLSGWYILLPLVYNII